MARTKAAEKITSHKELLERISFEIGRALLSHLETPTTAKTNTTAIDKAIDYLKLNGFDADAVAKVQREREAIKRSQGNRGAPTSAPPKTTYDYDVPSLDADTMAEIKRAGEQLDKVNREAADKRTIPDATNQ